MYAPALTSMEAALLKSRGYDLPRVEKRGGDFVAVAIRGTARAEAIGRNPESATRHLVYLIARP